MTEVCVITKDKDCVAYVIKEIATGMVLRWKRLGQVDNGRQRQYFLHTRSIDLGGCFREPMKDQRNRRWRRGSKGRRSSGVRRWDEGTTGGRSDGNESLRSLDNEYDGLEVPIMRIPRVKKVPTTSLYPRKERS